MKTVSVIIPLHLHLQECGEPDRTKGFMSVSAKVLIDCLVLLTVLLGGGVLGFSRLRPVISQHNLMLKAEETNNFLLNNRAPLSVEAGLWSHFLSLTFSDITKYPKAISELRKGVDAFELRVDLLSDQSPEGINRQISFLRNICPLPIVYTVRTSSQIGQFPDNAVDEIEQLLNVGLEAGVEWLDVEACLPEVVVCRIGEQVRQRRSETRILGSLHTRDRQSEEEIQSLFDRCQLYGYADMVKVVTGAANDADCMLIHEVGSRQNKPYIGLCLGEAGQLSRVLNRYFTPVSHPLMAAAAPGQLSAAQLMIERERRGLVSRKEFYLFGTPIQHSLSPKMHNTAFGTLLLPYHYSLAEQDDVKAYTNVLQGETFGGASVTIPHKESIMGFVDEVAEAASKIGAVNTIVVQHRHDSGALNTAELTKILVGHNTDWLGMYRPLDKLLKKKSLLQTVNIDAKKPRWGVVIGAGGTARAACYTLQQLGLKVLVANRSKEKALDLSQRFDGAATTLKELGSFEDTAEVDVVISTLPASAAFTLPNSFLNSKPVVLDVVYKPASTPLLHQAQEAGCFTVQGATMLLEQGIEQFQLWHQRTAPRTEMTAAIFSGVEKIDST